MVMSFQLIHNPPPWAFRLCCPLDIHDNEKGWSGNGYRGAVSKHACHETHLDSGFCYSYVDFGYHVECLLLEFGTEELIDSACVIMGATWEGDEGQRTGGATARSGRFEM